MTISTTSNTTTQQGNGANTTWNYSFLIPESGDEVVTLTLISDGSTQVLDHSVYTLNGAGNPAGGSVTYPLIGSPLSALYNITIQRILPLTQETDLVNQDAFYADVVESEFDNLVMLIQQLQQEVNQALAFPVGSSSTSIPTLMTAILNGAANAAAAASSAAAAAASAATVLAALPVSTANIQDLAVTTAKIANNAVGVEQLATETMALVGMLNGTVVESHAANAVTFSIKTLAGADPSATDPVRFVFRNVTAGTGNFVVLDRTTAMSFTISAGSTMGTSNNTAFRIWLTVFNDASTLRLGAINCLSGTTVYPLQGWGLTSSTAEGGAGGADSAQVFYTGAAVTSKAYITIGYAAYESGLGTAGNWSASPTRLQLHSADMPLPGREIQCQENYTGAVATGSTALPIDDTIPQITEGDQYMTQAITPTSAANLLRIDHSGQYTNATGATFRGAVALFQDATANALATTVDVWSSGNPIQQGLTWSMLAATTSATTFRVRAGTAANTTTFNGTAGGRLMGGVINSYLKVKEIMA